MENEAKVEQYLLLAKNARGLALVDLIAKATAEPGLYTYGELLALPGVRELEGGEYAPTHALLQLFAFGTWSDYKATAATYPPLSQAQQRKLKLLSVASLCRGRRMLQYDELLQQLEVPHVRELEDMLIADCLYGGLLKGKLDQQNRCLHVEDAFSRDVPPDQLAAVWGALGEWLGSASEVLASIEQNVAWTTDAVAAAAKQRAELEASLESERKSIKTSFEMQTQQDNAAMLMDERDTFSPGAMEEDARPTAGSRHTKRRR